MRMCISCVPLNLLLFCRSHCRHSCSCLSSLIYRLSVTLPNLLNRHYWEAQVGIWVQVQSVRCKTVREGEKELL